MNTPSLSGPCSTAPNEPRHDLDLADDAALFFHHRASESGFTNLFDWFFSRQDMDDLEGLLISCHEYVMELIDEFNEDKPSIDQNTQLFRDQARQIGFDKLMALFLHDTCLDCAEGEMFAAESYINELIGQVTKTEKLITNGTNTRRHS
jgi:hypothetical protein